MDKLALKADAYLRRLCLEIPSRQVGGPGNQAAADFIAATAAGFAFQVECQEFDCLDWTSEGARLSAGGESFPVFPSPYSLGGAWQAPLVAASSLAELEALVASGKILLARNELAQEQLMPKNFPFYNPDEHRRIYEQLERARLLAVVAATGKNPGMAGALYPYPLIEDGDFDIPSVYLSEEEGLRLSRCAGEQVDLQIQAGRRPSRAWNVVARRGQQDGKRVVYTAHLDAKMSTPGALDNASGVATLLLLAELLADYSGDLGLEIVFINGEDYYAASGELEYLRRAEPGLAGVALNANLDGLGYIEGDTAYSLYGCPEALAGAIRLAFAGTPGLVEGEQWYQGDHMVFVQHGRPALALTSALGAELAKTVIHTASDTPDLVDGKRLARVALALAGLQRRLAAILN